MADISGKTDRLMGLSQYDNNVFLLAIPPSGEHEGSFDWYCGNLFTRDFPQSGNLPNINATFGLMLLCSGDNLYCVYCYPGHAGTNYGPICTKIWSIADGQVNFDHAAEKQLGFQTSSTPSACVVGETIYLLYRNLGDKLRLASFDLITQETRSIQLNEDYQVTTGPGLVPITSDASGLDQKLLLVWTDGNTTKSVDLDPTSDAFGNLHTVPGNGSPNDVCLRLLAPDTAILVQKGRSASDTAQVLTYKSGPNFSGKWAPHAHELTGVVASQTPCLLPYTELDSTTTGHVTPPSMATGLLVAYSDSNSDIKLKKFDTAPFV